MSQKPPFRNSYRERKVAASDAKSCLICFKPSTSVLITDNSKDWFYVCPSHLSDANFCSTVYEDESGVSKSSEHSALVGKESILIRKSKRLELEIESSASSFNKVKGYFKWGKKKKEVDTKDDNEDGKDDKKGDDNAKEDDTTKKEESVNAEVQLMELKGEKLPDIKRELNTFEKQYKRYKLDQVFYRNRLLSDYKKQKRAQIRKSLENGTLFPSLDNLPDLPKQENANGKSDATK